MTIKLTCMCQTSDKKPKTYNKNAELRTPNTKFRTYEKNILTITHHYINKLHRTILSAQLAIAQHKRNSVVVQRSKVRHLHSLGCVCSAFVCAGD